MYSHLGKVDLKLSIIYHRYASSIPNIIIFSMKCMEIYWEYWYMKIIKWPFNLHEEILFSFQVRIFFQISIPPMSLIWQDQHSSLLDMVWIQIQT